MFLACQEFSIGAKVFRSHFKIATSPICDLKTWQTLWDSEQRVFYAISCDFFGAPGALGKLLISEGKLSFSPSPDSACCGRTVMLTNWAKDFSRGQACVIWTISIASGSTLCLHSLGRYWSPQNGFWTSTPLNSCGIDWYALVLSQPTTHEMVCLVTYSGRRMECQFYICLVTSMRRRWHQAIHEALQVPEVWYLMKHILDQC